MKSFISTMALVLVCVACGSSGSGSGSSSGSVNGKSVPGLTDSVFYSDDGNDFSNVNAISFLISNIGNVCAYTNENSAPPSGDYSLLAIGVGNTDNTPVTAGTYNVFNYFGGATTASGTTNIASALYVDSSNSGGGFGSSGTVTLTGISNTTVSGSYNVTFVSASDPNTSTGTLSGSFSASYCDATSGNNFSASLRNLVH